MTLCTQPTPWPGLAFVHNSSWARVICSWWAVQFNWRFTWWGKIWGLLGFPRGKGSVQCVVTGILFGMCVMCCVVDSIRDSCCGVTCPTKFVCDCNGDSIQSQCDVCYSCWYLHTTLKDPLRLRLQGLLQLCSHWFPVEFVNRLHCDNRYSIHTWPTPLQPSLWPGTKGVSIQSTLWFSARARGLCWGKGLGWGMSGNSDIQCRMQLIHEEIAFELGEEEGTFI